MSGKVHVFRLLALLLAVWSLGGAVPLMAQSGVQWHTNLEEALQEAARTQKPLLVHIWASYCGPCKQMDRQVFSQPQVAQAMHSQFIPVKLSAEDPRQVEHIKQWGVKVIPTDVVLNPNGQIATEPSSGFFDSSTYLTRLDQLASAVKPSVRSRQSFADKGVTVPVMPPPAEREPEGRYEEDTTSRGFRASPHPQFAQYRNTAMEQPSTEPYRYNRQEASYKPSEPEESKFARKRVSSSPDYESPENSYAASRESVNSRPYQPSQGTPESRYRPRPEVASSPERVDRYSAREEYAKPSPRNSFAAPSNSRERYTSEDRYGSATAPRERSTAQSQPPQVSQPTPEAEQTKPVEPPPLGLEGYCPVRLVEEKRWLQGDKRYGIIHQGQLYLFAGADEQRKFWENPGRYAPVAGGYDPVLKFQHGYRVPGTRKYGVFYQDRVHLFACEDTLAEFSKSPNEFTEEPAPQAAQLPSRSNRPAPRSYPGYR